MTGYAKPKCPKCYIALTKIYIRMENKRKGIGYVCRDCKKYHIFKEYKEFEKSLYIGLKEVN